MDLKKRYKPMENVLNTVNSKYISLQDAETKRNNKILQQVTSTIVQKMKNKCILFTSMFERTFYGGSFYDNLKVGKPNEFDLDFVLNIPSVVEPKLTCTEQPGFVKVKITAYEKILTRTEKDNFIKLNTLCDGFSHLSVNMVLIWMEKTITAALNELPKKDGYFYVDIDVSLQETIRIYMKLHKGFPAFTLKLWGKDKNGDIHLDVDLVPCFQFTDDQWPGKSGGYRPNPSKLRNKFLIVPKKPKGKSMKNSAIIERFWRLSFQEQERELISGRDLKALKPALRLLKKLRDRQNHKIASYYIKTLFLWALEKEESSFWTQPLSCVFIAMLKLYAEKISEQNIPYYWNKKFNLLGYINEQNTMILYNIGQYLKKVIDEIENHLDEPNVDPFVVCKHLLCPEEVETLRQEVTVSKKVEKSISLSNGSTIDSIDSRRFDGSIPPLIHLGYKDQDLQQTIAYLKFQEEQRKQIEEMFTTQCKKNNLSLQDQGQMKEVINYLTKIDTKIDNLTENVKKMQEENKMQTILFKKFDLFNKRIADLEDKVSCLQLENDKLRKNRNDLSDVDHFLYVHQVEHNRLQ